MSDPTATIVTCEIAAAIKTALQTVCDAAVSGLDVEMAYTAPGVADTDSGGDEPTEDGTDKRELWQVNVMVMECIPLQLRPGSALRAYPVMIDLSTWQPRDKAQRVLYILAQAVSLWLCQPTLSLTLATWDALTIDAAPDYDLGGYVQLVTWTGVVHTRKAV